MKVGFRIIALSSTPYWLILTLIDWLTELSSQFGNLSKVDTVILSQAFSEMLQRFYTLLDINLLDYESLPGASRQILLNHYDKTINSPYSFSNLFKKLPSYIRSKSHGGFRYGFSI